MQDLGGQMTMMTAPLAAGLGYSVNQAQTFNRSMSNVASILGVTGDEAEALREGILAIGGDSVAGPQRNMESFYDIVSGGITDTALALETLQGANEVAEAGQADLQAVTSAMISTINAYGLEVSDLTTLQNVYTRTVQTGVLSMNELASAFPSVTSLGAQFGQNFSDMGAALALMTQQGYSASQSATFMRSMFTTLLNPTADLQEAVEGLGYDSGQSLIEAEGLVGAYEMLAEQNGGLAGLITNQEALLGALALTSEGANEFFAEYMAGLEGATDRAGAIQDETESFDLLRSKMQELAITIGDELSPVMLTFAEDTLTPLIDNVVTLANENPELVQTLLKLAGAAIVAGPAMSIVGTTVRVLAGALAIAISPAGLLAAAIGGLLYAANELYPGGLSAMFSDAATSARQLAIMGLGLAAWASDRLHTGFENLMGMTIAEFFTDVATSASQLGMILTFGLSSAVRNLTRLFEQLETIMQLVSDRYLEISRLGENEQGLDAIGQAGDMLTGRSGATISNALGPFGAGFNVFRGIASLFRADGGPVTMGTPYVVGERGPELFVPSSSGQIVPNEQMGGDTFNITVYQQPGESGEALARRIMDAKRRAG